MLYLSKYLSQALRVIQTLLGSNLILTYLVSLQAEFCYGLDLVIKRTIEGILGKFYL